MRRLFVAVVCAMFATIAQAQVFSAISTVVSIGQWLSLGQKRVYYIEVESRADSFDAARNEAFRLAIEQAVGTLVLSETESQNYRLKRNDIVTYASGYVDRYEIADRSTQAGQTRLRMKVWVAHSAIADRLLHQQSEPREVSGSNIAAQIQTFKQQQQSADRLLDTVLLDYPHRAFDIHLEPAKVAVDSNREGHLQVSFVIVWSKRYLTALEETLTKINQYPQCTGILADCHGARTRVEIAKNVFAKDPGAWFNDDGVWDVLMKNMVISKPVYKLTVFTVTGQRTNYCFYARELDSNEYRPRYFVEFNSGLVRINALNRDRIVLNLPLSSLPVADITQVNVDVVRQAQCN